MRVEYKLEMTELETPRFSVEAVEGIGKLFSLATLILNALETKEATEIVFHGLNPEDPERKIEGFKEIIGSSGSKLELTFTLGQGGRVPGSSSYYQWLLVSR